MKNFEIFATFSLKLLESKLRAEADLPRPRSAMRMVKFDWLTAIVISTGGICRADEICVSMTALQ